MNEDYPFAPENPGTMTLAMRLFWCAVFFGPAAYLGYQGEYLLAVVVACAGVGALSGYRLGALSMLTSIASISTAIIFAPAYGMQYESKFAEVLGTTGVLNRCVSIGVIGVLISMLVCLVVYLTIGRIVRRRPKLDRFNRTTGFSLGLMQGVLSVWLLTGGLLLIEPAQREKTKALSMDQDNLPMIHQALFKTVDHIDQSKVGPWLRQYNPFEKIPQLNQFGKIQRTAAVLSDPAKMNDVIGHPSIEQLQSRPEVRKAVEELRNDESLREILTSGQPITRESAMTLMSHPAVLNLIDQPGFLEEASKAIEDAGL